MKSKRLILCLSSTRLLTRIFRSFDIDFPGAWRRGARFPAFHSCRCIPRLTGRFFQRKSMTNTGFSLPLPTPVTPHKFPSSQKASHLISHFSLHTSSSDRSSHLRSEQYTRSINRRCFWDLLANNGSSISSQSLVSYPVPGN